MSPAAKRPLLDDPLFTLEEVAEAARAPLSSARWWVTTGKLRALRPGRRVLVRKSELERFLTGGKL